MRSFINLNNTQNNSYLANMPTERRIPSLASQYMDMFDTAKLENSILAKRANQALDNLYQNNLQKKVKTLVVPNDYQSSAYPQNLMFQQNNMFNTLPFQGNMAREQQNLMEQLQAELGRAQQIQNLNLILGNFKQQQQQPIIPQFNPSKLTQNNLAINLNKNNLITPKGHKNIQNSYVKEEYVKHEEEPETSQGSPSLKSNKPTICDTKSDTQITTDSLSEISSPGKNNDNKAFFLGDEPTLVEYTKTFPEWDLATIFAFLRSDKPKDSFEREKKFRMERKLRKATKAQKERERLGLPVGKGKDNKNKKQQYL